MTDGRTGSVLTPKPRNPGRVGGALAVACLLALSGCAVFNMQTVRQNAAGPVRVVWDVDGGAVVYEYTRPDPIAVVVLVPGLGINAGVFELSEDGLAPHLWRAGFAVFSVGDPHEGPRDRRFETAPEGAAEPGSHVPGLEKALAAIAARDLPVPIFVVGHGLGGTRLYQIATRGEIPVAGVATLGAPIDLGGSSKAFAALLNASANLGGSRLFWDQLEHWRPRGDGAYAGGMRRALLTTGLPEEAWAAFARHGQAPIRVATLTDLAGEATEPVPNKNALIEALAAREDLPILAIMAPSDGVAPPWQCDPVTLGLRRDNIDRLYLTQANGQSTEYNHLDLLLHPEAPSEIFDVVSAWLQQIARP